MKKILLLTSSVLIIAFTSLISCRDQSEVSSIHRLERGSEIAKTYGGRFLTEKVSFAVNAEGNLVGALDSDKSSKYFTLQKGAKDNTIVPEAGKYEMLYLKHLLILNEVSTGKKYLLTVANDLSQKITRELPSSYLDNIEVVDGYGLAITGSVLSSPNARPLVDECAYAGGKGSTSCSNTCCSVSCSAGYYSSCGVQCSCVVNP